MATGDPCRVLVVDDDPMIRRLVAALLVDAGKSVHSVANGAEALECVHREDYDLIVLDLDMPVMDGREFCRRMKELGKFAPTLILSAYRAHEAAKELGASAALDKPFDIDEFTRTALALCEIAGAPAAAGTVTETEPSA